MLKKRTKTPKSKRAKRPSRPKAKSQDQPSWWASQSDQTRATIRGALLWIVIVSLALGGAVWALRSMERQLLAEDANHTSHTAPDGSPVEAPPVQFNYVMNYPDWMPAKTANEIVASFDVVGADFHDDSLLARVRRRAELCPWVSRVVNVSRQLSSDPSVGAVIVDCEFRRPVARLMSRTDQATEDNVVYVDAEGVRLPTRQVAKYEAWLHAAGEVQARWHPIAHYEDVTDDVPIAELHCPWIRGARGVPPVDGQAWRDDDVLAGLRLVALVAGRYYGNQITTMDVRNFGGRISAREPHLRMWAQVGQGRATDIRFGRFPSADGEDYVVSPDRKLMYLDEYTRINGGQLAGLNQYLDLQYDQGYASLN